MSPLERETFKPNTAIWLLLASLYCAQGLPAGLMAHALPAILRQQQVDLAWIGALKLLALPWLLKVLWAPWVDRYASARLGRHRGWILPCQMLVLLLLLLLACLPQSALLGAYFPLLVGLLLLINLACATQDIATDGLNVRLMPGRWRGLANSLQVGGYKVGMLISGSGLLLLMGWLGWQLSLLLLVVLLALLLVPIWRFAETRVLAPQVVARSPALGWSDYRGLLQQPGFVLWLVVLASYKLGDALASPMIKPMLVDQGWELAAIGQLTLFSTLAGIAGAGLGGWIYAKLGALWALLVGGVLQAIGLALMALLAGRGEQHALVYGVALLEQAADGASTVALFAAMMRQCRVGHEGADYTLQASAQLLVTGIVGAFSGGLAKYLGYDGLFIGSAVLSVLVLSGLWACLRGRPTPR